MNCCVGNQLAHRLCMNNVQGDLILNCLASRYKAPTLFYYNQYEKKFVRFQCYVVVVFFNSVEQQSEDKSVACRCHSIWPAHRQYSAAAAVTILRSVRNRADDSSAGPPAGFCQLTNYWITSYATTVSTIFMMSSMVSRSVRALGLLMLRVGSDRKPLRVVTLIAWCSALSGFARYLCVLSYHQIA